MSKNEIPMNIDELTNFIQKGTSVAISGNFVTILTKLAQNNDKNVEKFVSGCKALGLKDENEFLRELHEILLGFEAPKKNTNLISAYESSDSDDSDSNETHESLEIEESINPVKYIATVPTKVNNVKKKSLILQYSDDSEEDTELVTNIVKEGSSDTVVFKKIDKLKASKLKEYSELSLPKPIDNSQGSDVTRNSRYKSFSIPTSETFMSNEYKRKQDMASDHEFEIIDDIDGSSSDIQEEREWYNHDDDYGNEVASEEFIPSEIHDMTDKKARQLKISYHTNDLHSEIQLFPIPLSRRKHLLPSFIKNFSTSKAISSDIMPSSFLDNNSSNLINPFKNPESEFSVNARKGSLSVAQRRKQEYELKRSKESVNLEDSSIGNVLGLNGVEVKSQPVNTSETTEITNPELPEDIKKTRKSLPAYKARGDFLRLVRENQVIIVIGETGSGKTTQLAQYLYEDGYCSNNRMIGCTQPRRVAAMSVAKRVAHEMGVLIGAEVGYSIRFEDKTSRDTRIKFLTDGILLREFLLDNNLERYSTIIIDEAHERALNTDIIMGLFKNVLLKRRDLKLIITSATLNAAKFSSFFGDAPQFRIPGRTFPVELVYSKHPVSDYVQSAVFQAVKIHVSTKIDSGDILIFMTGQEDIEATAVFIKEKLKEVYSKKYLNSDIKEINDFEIYPIYSALPADIQSRIFMNLNGQKRKIVIATNIAETSLTIDGIRYVIDCGYSKLKVFNSKLGLDSLSIVPIAISNANQRSGRAGRTQAGIAYRLYTERSADEDMYKQPIPEIQRTNLSNTLLLLKSAGVEDVLKFPFIDKPPQETLLSSLYELWFIGALDEYGKITSLGAAMSKFPILPSLSKILLIAAKYGCSEEVLTIVSMLSVPQIFQRPKEQQEESDKIRSRFFVPESDHLTLLNIFSQWKSNKFSHKWCNKNFINYKSLIRAVDIRSQLVQVMKKNNIRIVSIGKNWDIVRKCLCSGYTHQAAKLSGLGKYVHLNTGIDILLHPTSALYGLGDLPQYVVYHELLVTSKEYICCVTSVDPFWLMEYGSVMYNIKRIKEFKNEEFGFYNNLLDGNNDADFKDDNADDELVIKIKEIQHKQALQLEKLENGDLDQSKSKPSNGEPKRKSLAPTVKLGFKKRRPL